MRKTQHSNEFQIRPPAEKDLSHLVTLENLCFTDYYRIHRFKKSDFQIYLRSKEAIFFVAIQMSSLAGYVAGHIRLQKSLKFAHLDSIAVEPALQNKSIGKHLLQRYVTEAKSLTCRNIMLEVATANEIGIRFFSKHGFHKMDCLPDYYGKGFDGILMRLAL